MVTQAAAAAKDIFTPRIPSKNISLALPGITSLARQTTAELLEQNHAQFHCFFNERGFHNHLNHALLASYSMGASPQRLRDIYADNAREQAPIGPVLKTFTSSDWKSEFGKREYYHSYLEFFRNEITRLGGPIQAIVHYAFDEALSGRFISGAFHPLIQTGYGIDFGTDALVAEGLALTAMTTPSMASFLVKPATTVDKLAQKVAAAQLSISSVSSSSPKTLTDILSDLREDRELDDVTHYARPNKVIDVSESKVAAQKIHKLVSEWVIEENAKDIEAKTIDLYKAYVLIVGATGFGNGKVKQDFFLMHALTSVLFVHRLVQDLPPRNAVSLLKSHLSVSLAFYIARGRPKINMDALLNYKGKQPLDATNPWLSLIKRAIDIDEVHVTKVVRACALGDLYFGTEEPFGRLLVNTAQIALDLHGDWEFEGVGWPEAYE
ncbi:hypothetical protein DFQ27_006756 [Actinomortierella ambigua]|uniref:Oxidoreductase AflY n=1 Tax=Actinomortierella ambigua TaxID=1343610 RepID=A0A9P6PWR4_9FUNG|nr:hypothetical protein DFQ27_006756 [Actinomortierella ambigua]